MAIADRKTYLADVAAILRKHWKDNRTVNIVCHGHSVPSGYFATPFVDTFNAYPHLLHLGLKHRFPYAVINVIVTAIGGENAELGARRFENEVLCHRPDVVTIDYSLNDRGLGLERARAAWETMLAAAQTRGVIPVPPRQTDLRFGETALRAFHHATRAVHALGLVHPHVAHGDHLAGVSLDLSADRPHRAVVDVRDVGAGAEHVLVDGIGAD